MMADQHSSFLRWWICIPVLILGLLASLAQADDAAGSAIAANRLSEGITETQARLRIAAVAGTVALGVGVYGMDNWWQDGFSGNFRTVNEGWFGEDTGDGGADKLGHAFGSYVGTRTLSWLYEALLSDRERALKLGLITTLGAYTAIEIIDGYSEQWRFSKEDMLANVAGATLGYLAETHPEWDEKLDFRLHYRRSSLNGDKAAWDPLSDYSGQIFLVAVKANGFESLRNRGVLRYLELAVGYNARGFEMLDGVRVGEPSRHLYFGVSLNLSQVLNSTAFKNHRGGRAQRVTDRVLEFVQVPGTAAAVDRSF